MEIEAPKTTKLESITDEINRLHDDTLRLGRDAVSGAKMALRSALACGALLSRLRCLVGHGKWTEVIRSQTRITPETARRWIRLSSHHASIASLSGCDSIRQAYLLSGVLPQPKPRMTACGIVDVPEAWAENLVKRLSITKQSIDSIDVGTIPEDVAAKVAKELEPIVGFWHVLCKTGVGTNMIAPHKESFT